MKFTLKRLALAVVSTGLLTIYGCGGGGGGDATVPTTDVPVTVVDGAIENATVCLDKNSNGICDIGEPTGKTDASGKVTLKVDAADAGKFAILAVVGTDAKDADTGAVRVAFTLKAPSDRPAVVSPLTTLVQTLVESSGQSSASAEAVVRAQIGINVSLFDDFTKGTTTESKAAGTVARLVVVVTQQQTDALVGTVGMSAVDGSKITKELLDKAIQKRLLERIPDLLTALTDSAVLTATSPAAKEAALLSQANVLVASSGLTTTSIATIVAINNQVSAPPVAVAAPSAGFSLASLNFTDASNFYTRVLTSSLTQSTPDAGNNTRYVDRRARSSAGNLAKWGSGSEATRQADLHWNGSAWVHCPLNFENTSGARDAQGNSSYNYCDNAESGKSNRATFDVAGKTMLAVYTQARDAGFTNLTIDNTAAMGSATFPTGSSLFYQSVTPLTEAVAYYPGSGSPVGVSNVVSQYSLGVSAGGVATTQAAGTACNSAEFKNTSGANSTTLEGMISAMTGTPCVFPQGSFKYPTTTSPVTTSPDASDEAWGNSTVGIGTIGTAPVGTGATAPGFYSGNIKLRLAFKGTGTNPVTYYACLERFNNGSTRNCTAIGSGSYTIATLGDARVMTLNNVPVQASTLNYTRVFVERGGLIYGGYQSKPNVVKSARLNSIAATALLAQLGLPVEDPSVPLALTAGSYQGVWELRDPAKLGSVGVALFLNANGSVSCQDHFNALFYSCALTITDPAAGTFALIDNTSANNTASGTFNFLTGTGSGVYHDPTSTPVDGAFVAQRR